jgi:glycosyltransferase involved in cell wall biosynthesis
MDPKVVYLGRFDTCCGVSTYTEQLAQAVVREGVEVAVLSSEHAARSTRRACREALVRGIPNIICWEEDGDLGWAAEEVIKLQPAVLHVQHEFGIFRNQAALIQLCSSLRVATRGQIKVVLTAHTVPKHRHGPLGPLMEVVDHLIVHSPEARRVIVANGTPPCPIAVIPHGMLPPQEVADPVVARVAFGDLYPGDEWQDQDIVTALSLGFISQSKKHHIMLEAFGFLKQQQRLAPKKLKFIIAGLPQPPSSGGEKLVGDLRTMVKRFDLEEDVLIMPEFVPFKLLPMLYGVADFTVHVCGPSSLSSSGSVRQDLSYGMPALVQRAELTADIPDDTVMFFKDEKDIFAMLPLMVKQDETRRRLRQNAHAMARKYAWPTTAARHIRLYERVSSQALKRGRWNAFRRAVIHAMNWTGKAQALA